MALVLPTVSAYVPVPDELLITALLPPLSPAIAVLLPYRSRVAVLAA